MFSEKYLSVAIGHILAARVGPHVVAEFTHPVLAPLMRGPGRRPEIDFVVFGDAGNIKCAVETKWVGGSLPSIQGILWDLIRLEMVAHSSRAECFLVLGGKRGNLEKLFAAEQFAGRATVTAAKHPILRIDTNAQHKVILAPTIPHRRPILKNLFKDYQDTAFPLHIVTNKGGPYPAECLVKQHQVYAWRVTSPLSRKIFYPKNSRHYVASVSE
jgi:hypothetical protein